MDSGDKLTDRDESYWDNYPDSYNNTIEPDDIKLLIGRIMQYGYTGNVATSWRTQNEGGDKLAHAVATQILIWETVVGERNAEFNKVTLGGNCNALCTDEMPFLRLTHILADGVLAYVHCLTNGLVDTTLLQATKASQQRALLFFAQFCEKTKSCCRSFLLSLSLVKSSGETKQLLKNFLLENHPPELSPADERIKKF